MKIIYFTNLLLVCQLLWASSINDNNIQRSQSNPQLLFNNFISGTKYAFIELDAEEQKAIDTEGNIFLQHFADYLKQQVGFEAVALTSIEKKQLQKKLESYCYISKVSVSATPIDNFFTNHSLQFESCNGDTFTFLSNDTIYNGSEALSKFDTLWNAMHQTKVAFSSSKSLQLAQKPTAWNKKTLSEYFSQNKIENIEGIYEKIVINSVEMDKYKLGVVKDAEQNFDIIYLEGAINFKDWNEGELMGKIITTGTDNFYKVEWFSQDKKLDQNVYVALDTYGLLHFTFANSNKMSYLKLFPKRANQKREAKATGSGVAISPDGYIITNHHVVEGGTFIEVEAKINGETKIYNARIAKLDAINDIAVLKIDDPSFYEMPTIPYTFRTAISEIGDRVFTLGYPLTSTMGTDVKLTDGIISAQTGYDGDVSTYQTSVPVQPGNSGGPLFDTNGNLIGIIRAKHAQAENATYAIKCRNLLNLLDLLPKRPMLPTDSQLRGKTLPEQVKTLQNYVYLIRVLE